MKVTFNKDTNRFSAVGSKEFSENYAVILDPDTNKYKPKKHSEVFGYASKRPGLSKGYIIKVRDAGNYQRAREIASELNYLDSISSMNRNGPGSK